MNNVFRRYWTPAEQSKLLATVKGRSSVLARRDAAVLAALIATGFRIGEFSQLNVADAEAALATRWLFVPRERRKGGKIDHQVPVTRPIGEALEALLAIHREMGGTGAADAPLVFSRKHARMSIRAYQERVAHWCAQAAIEGSPHFARHTRAMDVKRRSTSNDWRGIVKSMLGHSTLESSSAYTGLTKEDLQREMEAIDGPARVRKGDLRRLYEERRAA